MTVTHDDGNKENIHGITGVIPDDTITHVKYYYTTSSDD